MMRASLKEIGRKSIVAFGQEEKAKWLMNDPAQITLLVNLVNWCVDVEDGFRKTASNKNAMRGAYDDQVRRLKDLIKMVQGDLSSPVRQKIMCMITMDAHSRDIIDLLDNAKVTSPDEFQW